MYAQAAIKPNTLLRNSAYGIVMRGVQKCTCAGASLRGRNSAPLCCIKLETATDPCCGSSGMFVRSTDLIREKHGDISRINIYGQEKEAATYRLAKMNLALRGISHNLGEESDSTFTHDLHKGLYFNYIMANPPFNLKGWYDSNLKNDSRWINYATPPESNANYVWILHILSHLKPLDGVAGFLLANGALGDSDTSEIRKKLIQNDKVEAIVILPRELFITTDISVTLWILNQNKKSDYLFMYFNRPEFDRYARFNSWGSARETFNWEDMCDIEIDLPDIPTQQKYVDIYKAMVANQQSYERGLEDLKLVCDGYIEDLRLKMPCKKIGQYLIESDQRNDLGLTVESVRGLSTNKEIIPTKADMSGVRLTFEVGGKEQGISDTVGHLRVYKRSIYYWSVRRDI